MPKFVESWPLYVSVLVRIPLYVPISDECESLDQIWFSMSLFPGVSGAAVSSGACEGHDDLLFFVLTVLCNVICFPFCFVVNFHPSALKIGDSCLRVWSARPCSA